MDSNPYLPPKSLSGNTQDNPNHVLPGWLKHVILASCVTLLLSQRYAAFLILPVFPWLVYTVRRGWRYPPERRARFISAGIWCLGICVVLASHIILYRDTRAYAEQVITKIDTYRSEHGSYPVSLDDIGLDMASFHKHLGNAVYFHDGPSPSLIYPSSYVPSEEDYYDFGDRTWGHLHH